MKHRMHSVTGWWLTITISLGLSLACASFRHRTPDPRSIAIYPTADTVLLRRTTEGASFAVTIVVRNNAKETLQVDYGCGGPDAQREIDGTWQSIWSPVCVGFPAIATISSGDSIVLAFSIFGFSKPNWLPQLDPRMIAGRYRIQVGVWFAADRSDDRPPRRVAASNTFYVRESNL